jgi:hypothetical protein
MIRTQVDEQGNVISRTDKPGDTLRKVCAGSEPPIYSETVPLIRIRRGEPPMFFTNAGEKLTALRDERKRSDVFLVPWPGQWRTDVFEVSNEVRRWWIDILDRPRSHMCRYMETSKKPWDKKAPK